MSLNIYMRLKTHKCEVRWYSAFVRLTKITYWYLQLHLNWWAYIHHTTDVWLYGSKSGGRIQLNRCAAYKGKTLCISEQFFTPPSLPLSLLSHTSSFWTYLWILKKSVVRWKQTCQTLTRQPGPQGQHCRQQPRDSKATLPSSDLGESLGLFGAGSALWFPLYQWAMYAKGTQPQKGCPENCTQATGSENPG